MRPPLFLIFLTIFFVVFFLLSFFDLSPPATIPTLGFQNDFVILKDYWETGRGYTWWIFTLDKYQALNQEYWNIFSYFELPSNPDWKVVSLKWPWKILLKAPIFLLSEWFFPTIWKFLWWFLVFWFAILLHRKIYGKKDIILLMLLVFAFAPFQLFDLEYATLFFSASSLYFYYSSKKRPYLFMYFLFGIYASISRSDFFIFFSCFNIYFLVHSFSSGETFKKIFYVFSASTLFLVAFFLLNKIYYGGFFTLWYEVQSSSASVFASDTFNTVPVSLLSRILFNINKVSGYFLPYGFHISSISDNVLYVIWGQTGILLAFLIPSFFSKKLFIQWPFRLKLFILLIIFYSFAFYGSDANSYKPPSPQFSSYTRYFSIFLFMFWIFFYSYFFQISRFSKILLSSFLIFLIFTWIHFT